MYPLSTRRCPCRVQPRRAARTATIERDAAKEPSRDRVIGDDGVRRNPRAAARRSNTLERARRCDEAFVAAAPMLGAGAMTVRAAGVYALERLLAEERTLHDAVVRTLVVFIRERAPARGDDQPDEVDEKPDEAEVEFERPADDVTAALRALARRPVRDEADALDLSSTRLAGAELSGYTDVAGGARFAGVRMFSTELYGANLRGANLTGATLSYADLRMSWFQQAGMAAADLTGAKLDDADLDLADLRRAHLDGASMVATLLQETRLDGANMTECDLRNSGLAGAVFDSAYLNRSDMRGADLWRARLVGTHLGDVDLRGADLREADLSGAVLEGADLRGTDLSATVGLTREQLARAKTDGETILPADL